MAIFNTLSGQHLKEPNQYSSSKGSAYFSEIKSARVLELFKSLKPLTLPHKDYEGNLLQIWKVVPYGMIGSVMDEEGNLKIISANKICNPLNRVLHQNSLISRLEAMPLKEWDLVYKADSVELTLWPHLLANGKEGTLLTIEEQESKKKKHIEKLERHVKETADAEANNKEINKKHICHKKVLPDGRIRYYRKEDECDTDGPTRGRASVSEFDPKTGRVKMWMECRDHNGKVNRVHPKMLNGIEIKLPHYPPTGKDIAEMQLRKLAKTPAQQQFQENLQKTGLTKSFNSNHAENPVPAQAGQSRDIGGVGCSTELIKGLFDKPESLFETEHIFFIPHEQEMPFTNQELCQLLKELAVGIFVHDTVPFFSLHFNQKAQLYPVIHPAYENTLVGQVFSMLDYFMKGYLNGGVFQEAFVKKWQKNPSQTIDSSMLNEIINLKDYCETHLEGKDRHYYSVRELTKITDKGLLERLERVLGELASRFFEKWPENENPIFSDYTKFTNSFRIIAKQKNIQKTENIFCLNSDFEVQYTIVVTSQKVMALRTKTF